MELNTLSPKNGAVKTRTRVGRGIGSGKGKTCGRGHKGQKSRTGVSIKGFEGGQMPLYQRMPKMGFNNALFTKNHAVITLDRLQECIDKKMIDAKKEVTEDTLVAAKVVKSKRDGIKLLGNGTLKSKIQLKITAASKSAIQAVEKAGGSIELSGKTVSAKQE